MIDINICFFVLKCDSESNITGGPPMNRTWLAALLPLLLAAPSGRAQDSKPADTVPASTQHPGRGVSPDPSATCG